MELALLTDAFVVISIYDQSEKRVTTFQSHEVEPEFSTLSVTAHERFRPDDVSNAVPCVPFMSELTLRACFFLRN